MTDEICMYIIARQDLGMSPGKLAAQVGHGVQLAIRHAENLWGMDRQYLMAWEAGSYAKVVLGVADLGELDAVALDLAKAFGEPYVRVRDEGRTEIPSGVTCLAVVPMPKSLAATVLGNLRLYR